MENKAQNKEKNIIIDENNQLAKGALILILSALAFSIMNLFIKMTPAIPAVQKAVIRAMLISSVAFGVLKVKGKKIGKIKEKKWLFLRCAAGAAGTLLNYYVTGKLMLADSAIIFRTSTIFILILSFLFLGEKITKLEVSMIFLAFFGVYMVVKPEFNNVNMDYLLALLGALCAAVAYTSLRALGKSMDGEAVVFLFALFSLISMFPLFILRFTPMSVAEFTYVIISAIFACIGQYALTFAYKFAPANKVSIYGYSGIIFSGMLGYIFFRDIPDVFSIIGYFLIFAASLILFLKNK